MSSPGALVRSLPALLVAAALAGCTGSAGGADTPEDDPTADLGLVATATTGILRGVAVDEAIRPIANVSIDLTGPSGQRQTRSNSAGAFGFDALPPGAYVLKAAKPGFFGAQSTVDVVAGVAEPPIVKLQLRIDAASTPFVQAQVFEGFIECTTSFLVLCGAPNLLLDLWCKGELDPVPPMCVAGNVTNDRFTNDFYFADNASLIQFEMIWESNQAISPELAFEMEELNGGCQAPEEGSEHEDVSAYNSTRGPSPIYATNNATQIQAWKIGSVCPIYFSVFAGGIPGAPCVGWCYGAALEQRFRLFLHDFHGFLPPPGWRFAIDGNPSPPA